MPEPRYDHGAGDTLMSVAEREELAQSLAVSTAPWLSFAVHIRDPQLVEDLLGQLDHQGLLALAVVLASQVPQPRTRPDDGVVDEVAVERAADGYPIPLTRAERAEAVRLMAQRRVPLNEIGRRMHMSIRSIHRALGLRREVA